MIKCSTMGVVALVIGLVACLHLGLQSLDRRQWTAPDVDDLLPSVSYNRFARSPSDSIPGAEIRHDLAAIATRGKAENQPDGSACGHGAPAVSRLPGG